MKDNKAEGSLRELLKGDPELKVAFKETIEEMQKPWLLRTNPLPN